MLAADGYLSAIAVSNSGHVDELFYSDIVGWQWASKGLPNQAQHPGTRVAASDPAMVAAPSGYRAAFVSGSDGHVYELSFSGNGDDWFWADLSADS